MLKKATIRIEMEKLSWNYCEKILTKKFDINLTSQVILFNKLI